MTNKFNYLSAFVIGAAVGAFAAFKFAKKKYETLIQEEVDSVKKAFSKKDSFSIAIEENDIKNLEELKDKIKELEYGEYLENGTAKERPYVISPDEVGADPEYEIISLTYYADQVLADENDELIEDADEIIGIESLTHFGEYEDDSVFVRNDELKREYEIIADKRNYYEVVRRN